MELYYTDGDKIIDQDGDGQQTSADTIAETEERKRKANDYLIDDGGSGGVPPSTPVAPTQPPADLLSPTQPPANLLSPAVTTQPPFEEESPVLATLEDIFTLFEPVIDSIIASTYDINPFIHSDAGSAAAATAWNAIPQNQAAGGGVLHPWTQNVADSINIAGHIIQFAGIGVRRDLVGDGYHDTTGERLWTSAQYDYLYSHPSLGTKTQLIAHLAAIANLKTILKTDVDSAPSATYEGRLLYYTGLKTQFDGYQQYAQETHDNSSTQVNLDYLNAYIEYSSYLLVATNYHIGTAAQWRPTTMPDILTIAAGGGHFQHTTALERMVHYKLDTPQFFDSEQINAGTWRLVRQNPAGSTTWHPKNDNLEGVDTVYGGSSYYGSRDHNENVWSVPFNAPRPGHEANATYSYPDEMFISNVAMTKWIYFPRTSILASGHMNVYASNLNSSPHLVFRYHPGGDPMGPWICSQLASPLSNIIYAEANDPGYNPQQGSLVFVRRAALPTAGGGQPSGA
jgi:hypothetical protein